MKKYLRIMDHTTKKLKNFCLKVVLNDVGGPVYLVICLTKQITMAFGVIVIKIKGIYVRPPKFRGYFGYIF